jgi:hypothetical protein
LTTRPPYSSTSATWLELELSTVGDEVRVSGRGSRGERPPAHTLAPDRGIDALRAFASKVARAVRAGAPLDPAVIGDAQAIHEAVFAGPLREVLARLREAAGDDQVLVRLMLGDPALGAVPWEALCKPGTGEGFLGTDPRVSIARGVTSAEPWQPREVRGAVRVLAIAPGESDSALATLRASLAPSIASGAVDWLDPIAGPDILARVLYDRLRRGKVPHVLHFLGHGGVDRDGRPVLRLADDEDGEETWLTAEALGRELAASFCEDLRLVVLEACEGARVGAFASAAEILARAGADAVVAHLWPVKGDVARTCSAQIYEALTAADRTLGDVGSSVAAARRTLLAESAAGFSPVLYLRSQSPVLFDFTGRRVARATAGRRPRNLAPALQGLLERPFTVVLGDLEEDRAELQQQLGRFMVENGDLIPEGLSLSALTERCVLRFGQDILHSLFQEAFSAASESPPPLIEALARFVPPGLHLTLLWHPYLERAVAARQPDRNVYAIQPALAGAGGKPRVVKRAAGASAWRVEPILPKRFDLDQDIVILRQYGGYSAEAHPILSSPLITEDDHIQGLVGAEGLRPPAWIEELLARPRIRPGLFLAISTLDWAHRTLLRWIYNQRPAPKDSVAIVSPGADPSEPEIWEAGGGLPGTGRIAAVVEDPRELAAMLDALDLPEAT